MDSMKRDNWRVVFELNVPLSGKLSYSFTWMTHVIHNSYYGPTTLTLASHSRKWGLAVNHPTKRNTSSRMTWLSTPPLQRGGFISPQHPSMGAGRVGLIWKRYFFSIQNRGSLLHESRYTRVNCQLSHFTDEMQWSKSRVFLLSGLNNVNR